jgi:ribonuclease HI
MWADGSCYPPGGCGGAAAILVAADGREREVVYAVNAPTTNQRMELVAVLAGLAALTRPCAVHVVSDSEYVVKGWDRLPGWRKRAKRFANADLWELLESAGEMHALTFEHVKGHNGDVMNERCDRLALAARKHAEAAS